MMCNSGAVLLVTALSLTGQPVNGFVSRLMPSSLPSASLSSPKYFLGPKAPGLLVCLHMKSSFPEDTSESTDFDAPTSLPTYNRIDSPSEVSPDLTPSDEQFAEYKEFDRRKVEFPLSENTETIPSRRKTRQETEAKARARFKSGDELIELRRKVAALREDLTYAKDFRDSMKRYTAKEKLEAAVQRVKKLEMSISNLCMQDPEFWYVFMLEVAAGADRRGDEDTAKKARLDAKEARRCIPQLNMHGLWVGKYGTHGYEMVNITYVGEHEDVLVATKVTGDQNVPRGEVSFTCNLSPRLQFQSASSLEPIELNARAAKQWGKRYLPRHSGKGQVASEGYQNAQWMDGQLILVGRFFSFAWLPISHQVFFGRPSPELVLKMLKEHEQNSKKDNVASMRRVAETMMDGAYWNEQEADDFFNQEGCFE
ncbi:hypothetical protein HJC23_013864 [Cyclotella cryptica]|uniref:UVR domain-containing protein n=1 Tax=Cyclotella cryptica TaxID=29204 RepID=A0ABD3QHV1_9STRA|eukprot:CCRYP_005443-RA/>CCRYP_005443-RA protein AED:0.02 eAED:0.02 QI:217/1/1/1/1/1/2/95/424